MNIFPAIYAHHAQQITWGTSAEADFDSRLSAPCLHFHVVRGNAVKGMATIQRIEKWNTDGADYAGKLKYKELIS
jgi:hypothetical protein